MLNGLKTFSMKNAKLAAGAGKKGFPDRHAAEVVAARSKAAKADTYGYAVSKSDQAPQAQAAKTKRPRNAQDAWVPGDARTAMEAAKSE